VRKLLNVAVFTLSLTVARSAEPKWIRVPSTDFEIYSSAGEGDTRRVLQSFERVRNFFEQVMGSKGRRTEPVHVVVFGSKKEYELYRPNDFATAFYTQIAGRDYIVLGSANDAVFPVAVHEYVHLVARNAGMKLPLWLNEGLADLFSTLQPQGDKVLVGTLLPGRMQALLRERWVPLATIISAGHDSPYYNEKSKAGSLYSEGWALTHMLQLSRTYGPRFSALVEELQKGTPSQQALEQTYGTTVGTLDKDLQAYLRSSMFVGRLLPVKLEKGENVATEPAPMFDVKLALLDLSNRHENEAEVRKKLEDLMRDDPKRPEPHVLLGYLAARSGQQEEAIKSFQKALDLGSRNAQMLWDCGRMAAQTDASQAMFALSLLLTDQPGRTDARLALAQIQTNNKRPMQAIATLSSLKAVTPADAPRLFQILAYAHMETGNRAAAQVNAQRWLDNTQDAGEKADATRLLRYLNAQDAAAARPGAALTEPAPRLLQPTDGDSDSRPRLARAVPPPSLASDRIPAEPVPPSISGILLELDCKGPLPKLVLQTDNGRVSFVMDDPKQVRITGLPDTTIDMKCGPQKQVAVRIQYDPPAEASLGVMGIARAIRYEPEAGKR
jgi:Tfp pilus assembly protein PilF